MPRIVLLDGQDVRVIVSDDDIDVVEAYIVQWFVADAGDGRPGTKRQVIAPDSIANPTHWIIRDQIARGSDGVRHARRDSLAARSAQSACGASCFKCCEESLHKRLLHPQPSGSCCGSID
jgi:hypothetical protein